MPDKGDTVQPAGQYVELVAEADGVDVGLGEVQLAQGLLDALDTDLYISVELWEDPRLGQKIKLKPCGVYNPSFMVLHCALLPRLTIPLLRSVKIT